MTPWFKQEIHLIMLMNVCYSCLFFRVKLSINYVINQPGKLAEVEQFRQHVLLTTSTSQHETNKNAEKSMLELSPSILCCYMNFNIPTYIHTHRLYITYERNVCNLHTMRIDDRRTHPRYCIGALKHLKLFVVSFLVPRSHCQYKTS
uniref:Uncharacterized protein n=1 Tax=Cacopsylla melanoneura TaxID=428564 RepID=A0A8D8WG41_9HEMI